MTINLFLQVVTLTLTQIEEAEVEVLEALVAEALDEVDDEVVEIVGNTLYFLKSQERQCTALSFLLFSLDFCFYIIIYYFVMQGSIFFIFEAVNDV